ncbi:hypothetical protein V1264_024371 [Littorina saxatilis]|uniref:Uncharacterized protein n=1 Tax=Littorina saxatilis TaxID=31220 RepID=A0AAN9AMN9_9CAEN
MPVKSVETPQPQPQPQLRKLPVRRQAPPEVLRVNYFTLEDVRKDSLSVGTLDFTIKVARQNSHLLMLHEMMNACKYA